MRIVLSSPSTKVHRTGNRCTAQQWADLFRSLGHAVEIAEIGQAEIELDSDFLVALHGKRSHPVIRDYRVARPDGKVVVAMTGTDIYPEAAPETLDSIGMADAVVVLQERALKQIPEEARARTHVIFQAATPYAGYVEKHSDQFTVSVVGHLREVKDPLRTAKAARLLPDSSKLRIEHAGGILEDKYSELVETEERENPRYHWLGELDSDATARLIVGSDLLVLSSFAEGGARVVGEAIVNGVPVLSSYIDGVRGLLGDDYPGYFPVGDTEALVELLERAENDPRFLASLRTSIAKVAPRFDPEREKADWKSLLDSLST